MRSTESRPESVLRAPGVRLLTRLTLLAILVALVQTSAWAPLPKRVNGFVFGVAFGFALVLAIAMAARLRRGAERAPH